MDMSDGRMSIFVSPGSRGTDFSSWACLTLLGWFISQETTFPTGNSFFFSPYVAISYILQMMISTISWWALTCWFKPCRTSPKGKCAMELNLYFRLLWFFCPHFSGNLWSVFIYLLTYREKERRSRLMVSAHLCTNKSEMTHVIWSHSGQHVEEGCQGHWTIQHSLEYDGQRGKVMCSIHKNSGLPILLLAWS